MNDLSDLLKHEILDLYSAETQILEALPVMIGKAGNTELKSALNDHLKVTRAQKKRLEGILPMLGIEEGKTAPRKKGLLSGLFGGSKDVCLGMKGIIDEGNKVMNEKMEPSVLDAAIIACAQKVEHYEICGYGTARTYARELGREDLAQLLEQTLNEEYHADDLLTQLAVSRINRQAEKGSRGTTTRERSTRGNVAPPRDRSTARQSVLEPVASVDRINQNDIRTSENPKGAKNRSAATPRKETLARTQPVASRTAGAARNAGGANAGSNKAIRGTSNAAERRGSTSGRGNGGNSRTGK